MAEQGGGGWEGFAAFLRRRFGGEAPASQQDQQEGIPGQANVQLQVGGQETAPVLGEGDVVLPPGFEPGPDGYLRREA